MPELPEIETICKELEKILIDKKILSVKINKRDLRTPIDNKFEHVIVGLIPKKIYRRAKYIIIKTNDKNNLHLIFHLGMTGALLYNSENNSHDHLIFNLAGGDKLTFNDPRRFGSTFFTYDPDKFFTDLGPEPLDDHYTGEDLFKALRKRNTKIKNILLNGKIIAGIGNIYACEILFEAKISPFKIANSLTPVECKILIASIKKVLRKAIDAGGTTFANYRTPLNNKGFFQNKLKVYQQEKCNVCNNPIIKFFQFGRKTFFCEYCQSLTKKC
ncbi:MAG: bifunctional DNA-formamidopyrimidine glycosylase/DNA-(apurinic or apyrimidinic site) lyase [Rickettsiaceae bacterium H1]|nr:bifunctional DNA-formamidopyrimidine glycosylase/DNA-(apurinic or apyrimidinic site) lyase [Rickettsiaceae bacterium H1]